MPDEAKCGETSHPRQRRTARSERPTPRVRQQPHDQQVLRDCTTRTDLAKRGDPIMGGVAAFVLERCESDRGRASNLTPISVAAQEPRGVGEPSLDGSPELCHWVRERTACAVSGTGHARASCTRAWRRSSARCAAETIQSTDAERQERPLPLDCTARTMTVNPCAFAAVDRLGSTRSQTRSSAVIARCTAAGCRCGRRQRGPVAASGGSGWSRRTPTIRRDHRRARSRSV